MTCGIYLIKNAASGKKYVGSSVEIEDRWRVHRYMLGCGNHPNRHLQRTFNLEGIDNLVFSVLEECSEAELLLREQHYIDTLVVFGVDYNFSRKAGSPMAGLNHSAEAKEKMSRSRKGKSKSEAHRKAIGDSHRGKPKSKEHVENIKKSSIGKKFPPGAREKAVLATKGIPKSEKVKKNMAIGRRNYLDSEEYARLKEEKKEIRENKKMLVAASKVKKNMKGVPKPLGFGDKIRKARLGVPRPDVSESNRKRAVLRKQLLESKHDLKEN